MNVHSFLAFALSKDEARLEEAITEAEAAVGIAEHANGHEHPSVTKMLLNLGTIELMAGRYDDALETTSRVVTTFERQIARGELAPAHVVYGVALSTKATILLRMGQPREAARLLLRAHATPGFDYVFIARGGVTSRPWPRLLDDVKSALIRLAAEDGAPGPGYKSAAGRSAPSSSPTLSSPPSD